MTNTPSTSTEEPIYPTEWRRMDIFDVTEVRQTSDDTYQIRTPYKVITINSEGFRLYRNCLAIQDFNAFDVWVKEHGAIVTPRKDFDEKE